MNEIEIAIVKRGGIGFRLVRYPKRLHYVLLIGRTEARLIVQPENRSAGRAVCALVLAIAFYHVQS